MRLFPHSGLVVVIRPHRMHAVHRCGYCYRCCVVCACVSLCLYVEHDREPYKNAAILGAYCYREGKEGGEGRGGEGREGVRPLP